MVDSRDALPKHSLARRKCNCQCGWRFRRWRQALLDFPTDLDVEAVQGRSGAISLHAEVTNDVVIWRQPYRARLRAQTGGRCRRGAAAATGRTGRTGAIGGPGATEGKTAKCISTKRPPPWRATFRWPLEERDLHMLRAYCCVAVWHRRTRRRAGRRIRTSGCLRSCRSALLAALNGVDAAERHPQVATGFENIVRRKRRAGLKPRIFWIGRRGPGIGAVTGV